jgi:AhpD family alkylhydroperoxidase
MTLSYAFKTRLFWIVSRTNNCHYCLGHQEQKLSAVGMTDDQIAALDFDWLQHPESERPAFAYARKLTWEPHRLTDADFTELRKFYTDLQILEMTLSVAWNNSINRWKEGLGVPQSQHGDMFFRNKSPDIPADRPLPIDTFLTPTSDSFRNSVSLVAAVPEDARSGAAATSGYNTRPKLESADVVREKLTATREPRLPLVEEAAARELLGDKAPAGPLPHWMRLLANFPNDGGGRVPALLEMTNGSGVLTPLQKAQIAWVVARQDRAWYAVGQAYARLRELGQTDEQVFALDGDWQHIAKKDRAILTFARQLATTPIALSDEQFAAVLSGSGPETCVQLVNYTVGRVYFDRVTEAAALPLDSVPAFAER